jgi:hypothetical protein
LAFALETFDETLHSYLIDKGGDTETSRVWKVEIVKELRDLHEKWGFYHRDVHIKNVGIKGNDWILFDFGMSLVGPLQPYRKNQNVFYERTSAPSIGHDERLLRLSWASFGDADSEYVDQECEKIKQCDTSFWRRDMPVLLSCGKHGIFLWEEDDGRVLVEVKTKRKRGDTKKSTVCSSFPSTSVKPDVQHEHIAYYVSNII